MKLVLSAMIIAMSFSFSAFAGPDDDAYFREFLYRADLKSSDPDYPEYLYWFLGSDALAPVPIGNNQQIVLLNSVKMNADNTYTMLYSDGVGTVGESQWMPRHCRVINGKWSVPDKSLILADENGTPIIQGDRLLVSNQNAVQFTYLAGFFVPELVNKSSAYMMTQSQTVPNMTCMFPGLN